MEIELGSILNTALEGLLSGQTAAEVAVELDGDPTPITEALTSECARLLGQEAHAILKARARQNPFLLIDGAFVIDDLPDTPTAFLPIPACATTVRARLATLALHGLLGMETVSYRSENDGGLFVNLVPMPGEGRFAEKSTKSMRGHTDACSFPFPGTEDPENSRIAPSPDFVTLAGLRNPNATATTVIPLMKALEGLTDDEREELYGHQFYIECQSTFAKGTKIALGHSHFVIDAQILKQQEASVWVRFSHSKVRPDENNEPAKMAIDRFAEACAQSQVSQIINPGSILLINNRIALHGRSELAKQTGGQTRWLLRSYGLSSDSIKEENRYGDRKWQLFP